MPTNERVFGISLYKNLKSTPAKTEVSLHRLHEGLADYIEYPHKEDAMLWSPITYSAASRESKYAEAISCLVYDLDDVSIPRLTEAMTRLRDSDTTFFAAETYTPGRYRIILPLARDLGAKEYSAAWENVVTRLGLTFGKGENFDVDETGRDLSRFYYASSCPPGEIRKFYFHEGAFLDVTPQHSATPKPIADTLAAVDVTNATESLELKKFLQGKLPIPRGARDATLQSVMSKLGFRTQPMSEPQMRAALQIALLGLEDVHEEGLSHWTDNALDKFRRAKDRWRAENPEPTVSEAWKESMKWISNKDGSSHRVDNHTFNLNLILENDPNFASRIRYNMLEQMLEIDGGPLAGIDVNYVDLALSNWLFSSEYKMRMSKMDCGYALSLAASQHSYSPIQQYLAPLKWDGIRRNAHVLTGFCHATGNREYLETISRKFFISAVARAFRPGCQVDTVLTLKGPQGARKTSFAKAIAKNFFVETRVDVGNKDATMVLQRGWIVELSEMAGLRGQYESVRSYVSTASDVIRLPYARAVMKHPRQCVFIATTNNETALNDPDGSRRYWVVEVDDIDIAGLLLQIDQIWAEAVHDFRAGEQWWLSKEEQLVSTEENSAYQESDPTLEVIREWLEENKTKLPERLTANFILRDIYNLSPAQGDRGIMIRVGRYLARNGWYRQRAGASRGTCYVRLPVGLRDEKAN